MNNLKIKFYKILAIVIDYLRNGRKYIDYPIAYTDYIVGQEYKYPENCKKVLYEWNDGVYKWIIFIR